MLKNYFPAIPLQAVSTPSLRQKPSSRTASPPPPALPNPQAQSTPPPTQPEVLVQVEEARAPGQEVGQRQALLLGLGIDIAGLEDAADGPVPLLFSVAEPGAGGVYPDDLPDCLPGGGGADANSGGQHGHHHLQTDHGVRYGITQEERGDRGPGRELVGARQARQVRMIFIRMSREYLR